MQEACSHALGWPHRPVTALDIVLTMCQHNVRSAQTGFAQAVGKLAQSQPQALCGTGLVALVVCQGLLQNLHRLNLLKK